MTRHWRDLPVFAPAPQSATDRLMITGFRAWRLREPKSRRRYTVVRVEGKGGDAGYGEGGPVQISDMAQAKAAVVGIRATQSELIRSRLAAYPAMEAAVNNALIDLLAKSANTPIYQYLGGPTRFKARVLAHLEGKDEDSLAGPMKRAIQQGFKAFTVPVPAAGFDVAHAGLRRYCPPAHGPDARDCRIRNGPCSGRRWFADAR